MPNYSRFFDSLDEHLGYEPLSKPRRILSSLAYSASVILGGLLTTGFMFGGVFMFAYFSYCGEWVSSVLLILMASVSFYLWAHGYMWLERKIRFPKSRKRFDKD